MTPLPRSTLIAPPPVTEGMLNENACGPPMCGLPIRLNDDAEHRVRVRDRPDGRADVGAHPLLVEDDRGRQALEGVHVRPRQRRHEALDEGAVGLVDEPLRFGRDRLEDERALARAGHPGEHRQLALRDVQVDVPEVVLAGAADADGAPGRGLGRGDRSAAGARGSVGHGVASGGGQLGGRKVAAAGGARSEADRAARGPAGSGGRSRLVGEGGLEPPTSEV